jgi:hypothetical protein
VLDPSNAVIASVSTRQEQTGSRRVVETSFDGVYRVEGLDPGDYDIEISTPGFAAQVYRLTLRGA